MAQVILEQKLMAGERDGSVRVDSAAYGEPGGSSANPYARMVIKQLYGADLLKWHVPKKLTGDMVKKADLILVMEDYMRVGLPAEKVIVLDIPDPFRAGVREYGSVAGALILGIEALKQRIDEVLK